MARVIIFLVMVFAGASFAWCQEDKVVEAASSLQQVLSTLKESVDKMSVSNSQLAAQEGPMKEQILQLEKQLKDARTEGGKLDQRASVLRQEYSGPGEEIARLEKQDFELDDHIQKSQAAIKLSQQSLEAGYKEDGTLLLRLKDVSKAVLVAQQNPPQTTSEAQKLPKPKAVVTEWDAAQLRQLEAELKTLEKNYIQLKNLVEKISQKAQLTVSERVEEHQLEGGLAQVKTQGSALKGELDGLRAEMVELDKQKSRLELLGGHNT